MPVVMRADSGFGQARISALESHVMALRSFRDPVWSDSVEIFREHKAIVDASGSINYSSHTKVKAYLIQRTCAVWLMFRCHDFAVVMIGFSRK
jgi:hypothetical protein